VTTNPTPDGGVLAAARWIARQHLDAPIVDAIADALSAAGLLRETPMPDRATYRIPATGDVYANPYLACCRCGKQVTHCEGPPPSNMPCGHHADYRSLCPSWGPVEGCVCNSMGLPGHGLPLAAAGEAPRG
jgi:hypothetical protein